ERTMNTSGMWRGAGLVLATAVATGTASASGLAHLPAISPVMECATVTQLDLTGVTDAPVTLTSATIVPAGTGVSPVSPAPYCLVGGTIYPSKTNITAL